MEELFGMYRNYFCLPDQDLCGPFVALKSGIEKCIGRSISRPIDQLALAIPNIPGHAARRVNFPWHAEGRKLNDKAHTGR